MHRTFISLYILIVISVLLLGWLTEQIWQRYASEETPKQELLLVFSKLVIDQNLSEAELQVLANDFDATVQLLDREELSHSSLGQRIMAGETVDVAGENSVTYYFKLGDDQTILSLSYPRDNRNQLWLYRALLIGFYCSLALVVYFWVWPLIRDLKRLQRHAQHFAEDVGEVKPLNLSPGSGVYELAQTFNAMSTQIESLLSSQRDMSHAISHELRTPLARMKFALEEINSSGNESGIKALKLDVLEMDRLIREFLTYAKFDLREQNLEWNTGNIEDLLNSIVDSLQVEQARDFQIEIGVEQVRCDWVLMERCLANLLENANKYSQTSVRVSVDRVDSVCRITVEDDGEGVPEAERNKIFDAFYRSESATQRARGFGVGLALVRRIIELHLGTVSVTESALGGARFELSWPSFSNRT
jgi:two-component system OmpR family sensor kinase